MELAFTPPPTLLPEALTLGRVRLVVTDLGRSIPFYRDVLGLVELEGGASTHEARLGTPDGTVLIELEERTGAQRAGRHAGLYHVALLYPTREELASVVRRIARTRIGIDGASDHGTHEAIYLPDPDGNGLELAADRPRDTWPAMGDIEAIRPRPLDVHALIDLVDDARVEPIAADGLRIGHLHLHVGDIAEASRFYVDVVGFEVQAELPVAAFVSAGGYHHHLAYNTWRGIDVPAAPADAVGLACWTITLPARSDLDALADRAGAAGHPTEWMAETLVLRDPWGIELRAIVGASGLHVEGQQVPGRDGE